MKYTAINIGPISATFAMVRKPREFWLASYLFSHLMKYLVNELSNHMILISPSVPDKTESNKVGLYPDRAFFKHQIDVDINNLLEDVLEKFAININLNIDIVKDYFNIMVVTIDEEQKGRGSIISLLNRQLDYLELQNTVYTQDTERKIIKFLKTTFDSPLFHEALGQRSLEVDSLDKMAEYQIYKSPSVKRKSHHNYICIVQADGDNMGKVISLLTDNQITELSKELMSFGISACNIVDKYGGLPVYAGGDDVLFIAPVVGGEKENILSLLDKIDVEYQKVIDLIESHNLKLNGEELNTSMSYGVSITYCKFPLYEAWSIAGNQLFACAKDAKGKNAIAWKLQKHSGSSFEGVISKSDTQLYKKLKEIIEIGGEDTLVSAVSHKIRANEGLLKLWKGEDEETIKIRINSFFKKIIDIEGKEGLKANYLTKAEELLVELYVLMTKEYPNGKEQITDEKISKLATTMYCMLRTAKFINGEEEKV